MADVVDRAGASVGSLYHHFGGKADLYLALFEEYSARQEERAGAAVRAARAEGERDPVALFVAGARGYLQGSWAERDLARLFLAGGGPARVRADRAAPQPRVDGPERPPAAHRRPAVVDRGRQRGPRAGADDRGARGRPRGRRLRRRGRRPSGWPTSSSASSRRSAAGEGLRRRAAPAGPQRRGLAAAPAAPAGPRRPAPRRDRRARPERVHARPQQRRRRRRARHDRLLRRAAAVGRGAVRRRAEVRGPRLAAAGVQPQPRPLPARRRARRRQPGDHGQPRRPRAGPAERRGGPDPAALPRRAAAVGGRVLAVAAAAARPAAGRLPVARPRDRGEQRAVDPGPILAAAASSSPVWTA